MISSRQCSLLILCLIVSFFTTPQVLFASSDHGSWEGDGGHHGSPHVDMVPVVRTKVVPVEVEYSVGASDYVTYTIGPRTNIEVSDIKVVPDNFVKMASGEYAEGISLAGTISQTIQFLEGEGAPPPSADKIFAQIQVATKDGKRVSSVVREEINLAAAEETRQAEGNRISLQRRFFLGGVFIPYTQIGNVIYDRRGALVTQVVVTIVLVDAAGNILVGPAGGLTLTRPITIASWFLPRRIQIGIPWITFNPVILIPRIPIPFPGMVVRRPPGAGRPGGVVGGGRRPGAGPGAGVGIAPPGAGAAPGRRMGGGGAAGAGGQGTAPGATGGLVAGGGIGTASGVISPTLTITVPSKKQLVYWFSLPEKDGSRHEVTLNMVNYSIGIGLANLSVISKDQEAHFKKSRALIESLPNISVALDNGEEAVLKTMDLSDRVAGINPEDRTYILVFVAPTVDENVVEIAVDPAWAKEEIFKQPSEMSLPNKIQLAESPKK